MWKWIAIVAGVLTLLLVALVVAVPWFLHTRAFQAYIAQAATQALGRPVKFAALSVALLPRPTVKLRGLEVADDPAFRGGPFLAVREGRIGMRVRPLLSGRVELTDLTLEQPTVTVVADKRGRWNWASLGIPGAGPGSGPKAGGRAGGGAGGTLLLSRIDVVDGRIRYGTLGVAPSAARLDEITLTQINLATSQVAPGAGVRFEGDALAEPGRVRLLVREASLTPTGSRSLAEMALRGTVEAEVPDVAPLRRLLGSAPAVAGPMHGRFQISGTLSRPAATGVARSGGLVLSEGGPRCEPGRRQLPVSDLHMPLVYTGTSIESAPLKARVADGLVTFNLSIALGSPPVATLRDIKATGVDPGPILRDLLCQPGAVTGPMDLAGEARLHLDDPWKTVSGSGRVKIGPGRVTGKDVVDLINEAAALADLASAATDPERRRPVAPLEFTSITATYTIAGGVVRTDDLLYEAPDLRVTGAGTFGLADGRVNLALTLTQGRNEVKALVAGTAGSLSIVPTAVRIQDARRIRRLLDTLLR
jgi:AsmA protein